MWLPYFTYAYNSVVHLTTGYAPFELLIGENNLLPNDFNNQRPEVNYNIDDIAKEIKIRIKQAIEDVEIQQNQEKEKRKVNIDLC